MCLSYLFHALVAAIATHGLKYPTTKWYESQRVPEVCAELHYHASNNKDSL